MAELRTMDRRKFLQATGVAGGGLLLSLSLSHWLEVEAARAQVVTTFEPNVFLSIDHDGIVTIVVSRSEMGQGTRTGMPMIVAEELEVGLDRVRIRQADGDAKYGHQLTGGSLSVRLMWDPLRRAGAAARTMLIAAAARQWKVDPSTCGAEDGSVIHSSSGRRLDYGALVDAAARETVPDLEHLTLKTPGEYRLVGSKARRIDAPDIVTGRARYGMDTRMPGLRFAAIARCPIYGGSLGSYDAEGALAIPGVRQVVEQQALSEPISIAPGLAVIADDTWSALQGARVLQIRWIEGPNAGVDTQSQRLQMAELAKKPGEFLRNDGDVERALASSAQIVEATYELPYLAHAPMEPMNCTAQVRGSQCEIWTPTQNPQDVQQAVATALGIDVSAVTVHVTLVGGGFGRRLYEDAEVEAALLARQLDGPVMVVWTREDDLRFGRYRPMSHHVLRGGLDARGNLTAWHWRILNTHTRRFDPDDFPAHHVPNYQVEYTHVPGILPRGAWRSTVNSQNPFVTHSFFDELAVRAGRDPLEWRLQLLRNSPRPDSKGDGAYEGARMLRVVEQVADRSGWGAAKTEGRGRGVAFFYGYGSYIAQVAEVRVRGGEIHVKRVVCVADCGQVVNPDLVQAQIEGGISFGLSAALLQQITLAGGRVRERNFDDYPLLSLSQMPRIEGHLIESSQRPGGMGEPPLPPIAAAVANAVFDATGQRLRRLPLTAESG